MGTFTAETNQLITRLTADCPAVRRLPPPWRRTMLWLMISLLCIAAVTSGHLAEHNVIESIDIRMAVEQAAILLTGLTAALAAFSTAVPGRDWRISLLPLIPLGVWLGSLGEGCVHDWLRLGADGLEVRSDWGCVPAAVVLSIPCATIMVVMLRRGAPLFPSLTLALGALASAAMVNFGLRLFRAGDVAVMVLVWHFGGIVAVTTLAGRFGDHVLNWHSKGASRALSQ
jgi:negative regulator of sigma F NrsF-like protein